MWFLKFKCIKTKYLFFSQTSAIFSAVAQVVSDLIEHRLWNLTGVLESSMAQPYPRELIDLNILFILLFF